MGSKASSKPVISRRSSHGQDHPRPNIETQRRVSKIGVPKFSYKQAPITPLPSTDSPQSLCVGVGRAELRMNNPFCGTIGRMGREKRRLAGFRFAVFHNFLHATGTNLTPQTGIEGAQRPCSRVSSAGRGVNTTPGCVEMGPGWASRCTQTSSCMSRGRVTSDIKVNPKSSFSGRHLGDRGSTAEPSGWTAPGIPGSGRREESYLSAEARGGAMKEPAAMRTFSVSTITPEGDCSHLTRVYGRRNSAVGAVRSAIGERRADRGHSDAGRQGSSHDGRCYCHAHGTRVLSSSGYRSTALQLAPALTDAPPFYVPDRYGVPDVVQQRVHWGS